MISTLASAYAGDPQDQRDQRLGASHQHSELHERLADLAHADPDRFARLPHAVRLSVGHWVESRDAALRIGGQA